MRRTLSILAFLAIGAFVSIPALGQSSSLYEQEGTTADGYGTINATGQGPADPNTTNWKYQYGGGTWTAIYGSAGWLNEVETGDSVIDIECDIEMYYSESFADNKIYFHLGDPYAATSDDKTAIVTGNFTANNGMYIGTCFTGTSKTETDMLKDTGGNFTGEIQNAMVGTVDVLGRDISAQAFNIRMSLRWNDGSGWSAWSFPVAYGDGASSTIHDTLWWLVDGGNAGSFALEWQIELLPGADQPDGNYNFDPAMVAAPVL